MRWGVRWRIGGGIIAAGGGVGVGPHPDEGAGPEPVGVGLRGSRANFSLVAEVAP